MNETNIDPRRDMKYQKDPLSRVVTFMMTNPGFSVEELAEGCGLRLSSATVFMTRGRQKLMEEGFTLQRKKIDDVNRYTAIEIKQVEVAKYDAHTVNDDLQAA